MEIRAGGVLFTPQVMTLHDASVLISWCEVVEGDCEVFAVRGADGEFGPIERVSERAGADLYPDLAVAPDGTPWIAWSSWRQGAYADGNYEILVQRLDRDAAPQFVSTSSAADLEPDLVALGADLALVWTESYFPTRSIGELTTIAYDRWADKTYRVALGSEGVFAAPRALRFT